MPGYEILCIGRVASPENFARLFKQASKMVIDSGGLVRGVHNLGFRPLPYRMRAHTKWNYYGNYFNFKIQASPLALQEVDKLFKQDEDMIRWTPIRQNKRQRLPEKFSGVAEMRGEAEEKTFMRKHMPLDYSIAVELLKEGKVSKEELEALPKRKWSVPEYFKQQNKEDAYLFEAKEH